MTADEWEASAQPEAMIEALRGRPLARKFRLFVAAAAARAADRFDRDTTRRAIELLGVWADDLAGGGAVVEEIRGLLRQRGVWTGEEAAVEMLTDHNPWEAACSAAGMAVPPVAPEQMRAEAEAVGRVVADLARCILGNPFRPAAFDPAWRTITAVSLAGLMYAARDFSPMPILADALQDAGCDAPDVLGHCRGPGPHVRGCWVVDLLRGKG